MEKLSADYAQVSLLCLTLFALALYIDNERQQIGRFRWRFLKFVRNRLCLDALIVWFVRSNVARCIWKLFLPQQLNFKHQSLLKEHSHKGKHAESATSLTQIQTQQFEDSINDVASVRNAIEGMSRPQYYFTSLSLLLFAFRSHNTDS